MQIVRKKEHVLNARKAPVKHKYMMSCPRSVALHVQPNTTSPGTMLLHDVLGAKARVGH
jgi:hypothetical protein